MKGVKFPRDINGKIIVQKSICKTGNKKLIKKTTKQKEKARKDLYPIKEIFDLDLKPPFVGVWY